MLAPDTTANPLEVQLPKYYSETFFTGDSLLHPELPGGRIGVAGEAVPYSVTSDDIITSMLLGCLIIAAIAFAYARKDMGKQLKNFFNIQRSEGQESAVSLLHVAICLLTCLLMAIAFFLYVSEYQPGTFTLDAPYQLVTVYTAVFMAYFTLKTMLYSIVNNIFFSGKKSRQWTSDLILITALEGMALLPVVILQIYLDLTVQKVVYYVIFILVLTKILTFYRVWLIFFRQISVFLQIILYLCALEIVPMLSLWGILVTITNELKVTF